MLFQIFLATFYVKQTISILILCTFFCTPIKRSIILININIIAPTKRMKGLTWTEPGTDPQYELYIMYSYLMTTQS